MIDTSPAWVACPIWEISCETLNLIKLSGNRYVWDVDSPRAGGKYRISDTAYGEMGMATVLDEPSKVKLSRWIYEQNQREGEPPEINRETLEKETTRSMPSVLERMDYCLQFLASKTEALGEAVNIGSHLDEMQAAALLKDVNEIYYLIEEFKDEDWIKTKSGAESDSGFVVIRRKGYQRLEELKNTND